MSGLSDDDLQGLLLSWREREFELRRDRKRLRANLLRKVVALTDTSTELKQMLEALADTWMEGNPLPGALPGAMVTVTFQRHVWFLIFLALRHSATELAVGFVDEARRQQNESDEASRN